MGQDANEAHPNIIGDVVAALRRARGQLLVEEARATQIPAKGRPKGLSLEAFYDECAAAEKSQKPQQTRLSFKPVGEDAKVARIKRIEAQGPLPSDEPYICLALGLPTNFLRQDFRSTDSAVAAAQAIWDPGKGGLGNKKLPCGFHNVPQDDLNSPQCAAAQSLFSWFEELCAKNDPCLLIVQGGKGVGKSHLIAQWFWAQGQSKFPAALSLDCSGLSLDQIVPAVQGYFEGCNAKTGRLLVLDGLQIRRDQSGVWIELPEQQVHFDEILRIINLIWTDMGPIAIVMGVENNGKKDIVDADLLNRLLPNALHAVWRLTALTPEEGAEFLFRKGLHQVDEQDRRALSSRLQGLPIALKAAAQEFYFMSDIDREAYVANLTVDTLDGSAPNNDFLIFFQGWLDRHSKVDDDSVDDEGRNAHPLAVLRLLAILHGAVTQQELLEVVSALSLKRLSGRSFEYVFRDELPFVAKIDDKFELHAMVRKFLLEELRHFEKTGNFDAYTNRGELENIHWKAASMQRRFLKNETLADSETIFAVESFVHHMVEQIRLIPQGPKATGRRATRVAGGRSNDIEVFEAKAGTLSDGRLWWIAYVEARKWLLDSRKTSTRIYGQFEAKARILGQLLKVAVDEDLNIPVNSTDLRKEVALCWMHAGKLQLAQEALATQLASKPARRRLESDGDWLLSCDRASVGATIFVRRGDVIAEAEGVLAPFMDRAKRVAEESQRQGEDDHMPPLQRGALRILSRAADVALHAGNSDDALNYFRLAQQIQTQWSPHILNGEAARRQCVALIRRRHEHPDSMARANELVERNTSHYLAYGPVGSNDIISFLILRATLARVHGKLELSADLLRQAGEHTHIQRRQVTFTTRFDYDLEALRLGIVSGADKDELLSEARRLSLKMRNAAHNALRHEVDVVMAELLEGADREQHCSALRKELRRVNHRLRLADLDMLATGVSPTLHFGA